MACACAYRMHYSPLCVWPVHVNTGCIIAPCVYAMFSNNRLMDNSDELYDDAMRNYSFNFRDLRFSPEGNYLASVTVEMCLRVWDVKSGYQCKAVYYGPVNKFGFAAESEIIAGEATGNRKHISFE